MTQNKSSQIPDIQEVQARLEQWRQSRPERAPIPDELWAAAAALARRDGVNRTAAALRLDGGKLRRKMGTSAAPARKEPPAFVELMAGLLTIFAEFERQILRERTRAGLANARQNGKRLGRPATAAIHAAEVRKLHSAGVSKSEIARRVQIGRTSVRRILEAKS